MARAYLLLGSNKEPRENYLEKARAAIAASVGSLEAVSSIYETAAWGTVVQSDFLNQALAVETEMEPIALLEELKKIERAVGRTNSERWGPREIDIDILLYGDEVVELDHLVIPHPYLAERRFSLVALNEIAGVVVHPLLKKTIGELLAECVDRSRVNQLS